MVDEIGSGRSREGGNMRDKSKHLYNVRLHCMIVFLPEHARDKSLAKGERTSATLELRDKSETGVVRGV